MTKNRIISAIAALSLLAVPAVAAAHGSSDDHGRRGNDDHGRHHGHHHHKHHGKKAKTRNVTGTIASFTNGELTITLTNGKSFTADVTRRTVILCKSAPVVPAATTARHGDDDGPNHDAGDDHGNHSSTTAPASTTTPSTTVPAPTTANGNGARCGTDALVAGTQVLKAKLTLKDGSATWKKVTLVK